MGYQCSRYNFSAFHIERQFASPNDGNYPCENTIIESSCIKFSHNGVKVPYYGCTFRANIYSHFLKRTHCTLLWWWYWYLYHMTKFSIFPTPVYKLVHNFVQLCDSFQCGHLQGVIRKPQFDLVNCHLGKILRYGIGVETRPDIVIPLPISIVEDMLYPIEIWRWHNVSTMISSIEYLCTCVGVEADCLGCHQLLLLVRTVFAD